MQDNAAHIAVAEQDGAYVVEFLDQDILDELEITRIGEELNALIASSTPPRIVLDFSNVSHMSSAALGMLITQHKQIKERKGQLRLCRIRPEIYEVFVITKLNEVFQIHDDLVPALASLH